MINDLLLRILPSACICANAFVTRTHNEFVILGMSLIIARKKGGLIHIVSDTKLSYPEDIFPNKQLAAPGDGVIKATIINPLLCICFAGEIEPAEEAIKSCRRMGFIISNIKAYLLNVNKRTGGKTEFIVGVGSPENSIFEIKNGKIAQVSSAWIGSSSAFNIFQQKTIEESNVTKAFDSILDNSMDQVLQSGLVPEVNGFRVSVSNEGNYFHYTNYMHTNIPSRTYSSREGGQAVIEVYGTPQEGGYSVSLCENGGRNDVVAIHVRQGEFGVLYETQNKGLLWPKVIPNVDEHEFNEILDSRFGIKIGVAFSSLQKSYLNRGNKSFVADDFNKSIMYYELGLNQNEDFYRSALLFNKGLALLKLDRHNEASEEFVKAVKIDNKLEQSVQKVLFGR